MTNFSIDLTHFKLFTISSFSSRLLREPIEKATKANVVFTKTKKQQKAKKPRHSYQNTRKKLIVFKQRTCARLNETINIIEAVEEQGTVREDEVQGDQTKNIKNFTMITRDISIIAGHIGYAVAVTVMYHNSF